MSGNGGQVSLDATLDASARAIGVPLAKSAGGHDLAPEGLLVVVEIRARAGGLIARGRWPPLGAALLERASPAEDAAALADRALSGALVHLGEWARLLQEAERVEAVEPHRLVRRASASVAEARTLVARARGDEG